MLTIRRSAERGRTNFGWLDSYHSFSFGEYHDGKHMSFGPLRVINDDRVGPRGGFPTHPHRDMEIITYVLSGALEHKDSLGTGSVIRPGDVQRMTAGRGILHSEFNPSATDSTHLLQIWIFPAQRGLTPDYAQTAFPEAELRGRWRLIASPDGRDGSVSIHQKVDLYASKVKPGEKVPHQLAPRHLAWVQVARGSITLNGETLNEGDGASWSATNEETPLNFVGESDAEVLLFDMTV